MEAMELEEKTVQIRKCRSITVAAAGADIHQPVLIIIVKTVELGIRVKLNRIFPIIVICWVTVYHNRDLKAFTKVV